MKKTFQLRQMPQHYHQHYYDQNANSLGLTVSHFVEIAWPESLDVATVPVCCENPHEVSGLRSFVPGLEMIFPHPFASSRALVDHQLR